MLRIDLLSAEFSVDQDLSMSVKAPARVAGLPHGVSSAVTSSVLPGP
jgi:hypothetical protein